MKGTMLASDSLERSDRSLSGIGRARTLAPSLDPPGQAARAVDLTLDGKTIAQPSGRDRQGRAESGGRRLWPFAAALLHPWRACVPAGRRYAVGPVLSA